MAEVVTMTGQLRDSYDVVVIGGGAAGLSGALMLARSRRSVLVIDAGAPRNAPATAVHGLLARDGMPPAELLDRGRAEVRGYGGQLTAGQVSTVRQDQDGFTVTLAGGRPVRPGPVRPGPVRPGPVRPGPVRPGPVRPGTVHARRLLVATGLADELPDIPGLRERWGRDVVHCPYCHGWEVRDQAIGVLASGPTAVHQALLFRQLSDDVVLFSHTMPEPEGEEARQLAALGVRVVPGEVVSLEIAGDRLTGVRLADGRVLARQALAVAPRMTARAGFLADLGLKPTAHPLGVGEYIPAGPAGRTEVPGVWVAGNVTDLGAQVGGAAAAGAMAGAAINMDLVAEDAGRAAAA
jgi:thioredoxin reductase